MRLERREAERAQRARETFAFLDDRRHVRRRLKRRERERRRQARHRARRLARVQLAGGIDVGHGVTDRAPASAKAFEKVRMTITPSSIRPSRVSPQYS